jgi:23S rRNA (uracil1939-C5)-methyltransferase
MSAACPAPTLHEVTSLTHDGRGVAHVGGKALFIAGALPGERVTVRDLKKRRHFDEASVDSIEQASPERVTPRCAHFGICGGCCSTWTPAHRFAPSRSTCWKSSGAPVG